MLYMLSTFYIHSLTWGSVVWTWCCGPDEVPNETFQRQKETLEDALYGVEHLFLQALISTEVTRKARKISATRIGVDPFLTEGVEDYSTENIPDEAKQL